MIDFEKLDGFVIDLTTKENVIRELENVLSSEEDRESLLSQYDDSLDDLRAFIMEYYNNTYYDTLILHKDKYVYQILE